MDVALNRYEDMVAEEEKATEAAVAEGHLQPSVIAVEKNLHQVGYEVESLRHKTMLAAHDAGAPKPSYIEESGAASLGSTSSEESALHEVNERLRKANDALAAEA